MLPDFINNKITANLGFEPTPGQQELIGRLSQFLTDNERLGVLVIKGFAGTGKTSVISALVHLLKEFNYNSVLLAPTGRAAKVFSAFAAKEAFTIHKKIYRQKSSSDGFGKFKLDINLHTNTLFIVDEASMISNQGLETSTFGSGYLLADLIEYVYNDKNCKLILLGDTAQLPPVGISLSPALDKKELSSFGLVVSEVLLKDIVRQAENSGILKNATMLRTYISTENKELKIPEFDISSFQDIEYIKGDILPEKISDAYQTDGIDETLIICRSNKRANQFNQGIRKTILFFEDEITAGDYLMVVKNNYFWLDESFLNTDFIANGDIIKISRIKGYQEEYGFKFADVTIEFVDYGGKEIDVKILLDTLYKESAAMSSEENKTLFYTIAEDYSDIQSKRARYKKVKEDPFFNALQVKFAYAVTCHKAQGGQWRHVFIDQGYFTQDMLTKEYLRWLYTAVTRAMDKLYLVNFRPEFMNVDIDDY